MRDFHIYLRSIKERNVNCGNLFRSEITFLSANLRNFKLIFNLEPFNFVLQWKIEGNLKKKSFCQFIKKLNNNCDSLLFKTFAIVLKVDKKLNEISANHSSFFSSRMKLLIFLFLIIKFNQSFAQYFTVSGSKLIKPQKPYQLSVAFQEYESEEVLEISLFNKNSIEDSKNVSIIQSGVKLIELIVRNFY